MRLQGRRGLARLQSRPEKPAAQAHRPLEQAPWPEQPPGHLRRAASAAQLCRLLPLDGIQEAEAGAGPLVLRSIRRTSLLGAKVDVAIAFKISSRRESQRAPGTPRARGRRPGRRTAGRTTGALFT